MGVSSKDPSTYYCFTFFTLSRILSIFVTYVTLITITMVTLEMSTHRVETSVGPSYEITGNRLIKVQ